MYASLSLSCLACFSRLVRASFICALTPKEGPIVQYNRLCLYCTNKKRLSEGRYGNEVWWPDDHDEIWRLRIVVGTGRYTTRRDNIAKRRSLAHLFFSQRVNSHRALPRRKEGRDSNGKSQPQYVYTYDVAKKSIYYSPAVSQMQKRTRLLATVHVAVDFSRPEEDLYACKRRSKAL